MLADSHLKTWMQVVMAVQAKPQTAARKALILSASMGSPDTPPCESSLNWSHSKKCSDVSENLADSFPSCPYLCWACFLIIMPP
jgi:hypothetical protein